MKLYESHRAPNPRRTRLFMAEKGVDMDAIEFIEVDIGAGENRADRYRRMNPMGRVPVLELDDGTYLSESMAISRYFEALIPEPPLMGRDALSQATIEMWNRRMELNLLFPVAMAFRHISGYFKDREAAFPDFGQDCLKGARHMFDFLNGHLANSEYIAGESFSVADITALVSVDFARVVDLRIGDERPHLLRWHDAVSARPSATA